MAKGQSADQERAEYDAWVDAELERRLREADDPATKWIPHEQVMDEMQALLDQRIVEALARQRRQ
ncbi:MAG TPA: antitoxin [Inquilinus sp.]